MKLLIPIIYLFIWVCFLVVVVVCFRFELRFFPHQVKCPFKGNQLQFIATHFLVEKASTKLPSPPHSLISGLEGLYISCLQSKEEIFSFKKKRNSLPVSCWLLSSAPYSAVFYSNDFICLLKSVEHSRNAISTELSADKTTTPRYIFCPRHTDTA